MREQPSDNASSPADPVTLARRIGALRERLGESARVSGVAVAGTEEVILRIEGCTPVDAPATADGELHLLLLAPAPIFWLAPVRRRAPAESGFAEWLGRHLAGSRLTGLSGGESGRILRLEFLRPGSAAADPTGKQVALVLDPGPSSCRLLVLEEPEADSNASVAQRYPPTVRSRAQGRGAPGKPYEEPSRGPVPRSLPWPPGAMHPLQNLDADGPPRADAAPLTVAETAGRLWIRFARRREAARQLRLRLRTEARQLQRLATRLDQEVREAAAGPELRRQGEALLAAGRIPRGATEITLPDPSAPEKQLRVPLEPRLDFGKNVARLFDRARRLERALPLRRRKLAAVQRLAAGSESIAAMIEPDQVAGEAQPSEAAPDLFEGIQRELATLGESLEPSLGRRWQRVRAAARSAVGQIRQPIDRAGYESRRAQAESPQAAAVARAKAARRGVSRATTGFHPRRFELPGGWLVLVARSSRENDLLTHRHAAPRDLWFHAQGVTGSHVILRRGSRPDNPSRAVLAAAASIAAYYSKARSSGVVPVIYTEKRYVRKPRKAPAGLAVCIREKSLMVEPRLPTESAGDETAAED